MIGKHIYKGSSSNYVEAIGDEKVCQIYVTNPFKNTENNGLEGIEKSKSTIYVHSSYVTQMGKETSKYYHILKPQLELCDKYKVAGLVVHTSPFAEENVMADRMINICAKIKSSTTIYLEHMIQPLNLISLAKKIAKGSPHLKFGLCIDTCHMWASGFDLRDVTKLKKYLKELTDSKFPILVHLNDSKFEFGVRRDVHASIGENIWADSKESLVVLLDWAKENGVDAILERKDTKQDYVELKKLKLI